MKGKPRLLPRMQNLSIPNQLLKKRQFKFLELMNYKVNIKSWNVVALYILKNECVGLFFNYFINTNYHIG